MDDDEGECKVRVAVVKLVRQACGMNIEEEGEASHMPTRGMDTRASAEAAGRRVGTKRHGEHCLTTSSSSSPK